jgi:hypothetical protein
MKKRTIALAILSAAWLCLTVPVTRADIGGNIPDPACATTRAWAQVAT